MGSPPASPSLPLIPPPPTSHPPFIYGIFYNFISFLCAYMPLSLMNFLFTLLFVGVLEKI